MRNSELDARKMAVVKNIILNVSTEEEIAELEAEVSYLFHQDRPLCYDSQELIESMDEIETEYLAQEGISHEEILKHFTR